MATCVNCNNSGFFVAVNSKGLCNNCINKLNLEITQRYKIVMGSLEIVERSKNIETIITRFDLIMMHINILSGYDKYELINEKFYPFIETFKNYKEELILNRLKTNFETTKEKISVLNTPYTKINKLNKLKIEIQKYYPLIKKYEEDIMKFLRVIEWEKSKVKCVDLIDKAKKNEFKGNKKKALDYYYEALYDLKTDTIDDREQIVIIEKIQKKILGLGGTIREI